MSVASAASRPSTVALHGVSGAGFRMTVQPAARANAAFARLTCIGAFHGVMQAVTPTGSRRNVRRLIIPIDSPVPEILDEFVASRRGRPHRSGCPARGRTAPCSGSPRWPRPLRESSPGSAGACASRASCSCRKQRARKCGSAAQAPSSNAARAAAIASSMSSAVASAATPMTSSVAGLTFGCVRPPAASRSCPADEQPFLDEASLPALSWLSATLSSSLGRQPVAGDGHGEIEDRHAARAERRPAAGSCSWRVQYSAASSPPRARRRPASRTSPRSVVRRRSPPSTAAARGPARQPGPRPSTAVCSLVMVRNG